MPSFILRRLDPEFWARVQAKAKAENIQVKALILKLLAQWLGVLLLVGLTSACSDSHYTSSPLSPTALGPGAPPSGPAPTVPVVSPLGVALSIGRSSPEVGDSISFIATTGSPIASAVWTFGNGATASTSTGSTAYAYPAIGTFVARVTLTASDGRTGSDQATVTVRRRSTTPSPTPTPPHVPSAFAVSLACTIQDAGALTSCNVTASYHDSPVASGSITDVDWDWGDGAHAHGAASNRHLYTLAGTYTVLATVTATTTDGAQTSTGTKTIVVPNP